ncbi:unnamed protein product, partial [Musa acuminata subsp. burmannicoides]
NSNLPFARNPNPISVPFIPSSALRDAARIARRCDDPTTASATRPSKTVQQRLPADDDATRLPLASQIFSFAEITMLHNYTNATVTSKKVVIANLLANGGWQCCGLHRHHPQQ